MHYRAYGPCPPPVQQKGPETTDMPLTTAIMLINPIATLKQNGAVLQAIIMKSEIHAFPSLIGWSILQ
uniref:Uncharacterized protein n=1 Tax=Rhizophora mucronata TaxID=61149 RepID=A0A2P2PNU4_RHIMU